MKNTVYISLLAFIFSFSTVFAQHSITGQLKPKGDNTTMLLYKTEGAFQYYKASTNIDEEGLFGFALPEGFETGSYRLVYNTQENLYINIIYNNEDISLLVDPNDVVNSIYFFDSKENTLFFDYIKQINVQYTQLDSIQKLYYDDNKNNKILKAYSNKINEIEAFQTYFETKAEATIALSFIKSFAKQNPEFPLKTKSEYYTHLQKTYLENIDFKDKNLINSAFIIDRLIEYCFDLNEAIAKKNNADLDVSMIDYALDKLETSKFKNEIIYSLTSSAFDPYSSQYDKLLNHLYDKYYISLPETEKNKEFTEMLISKLNVIVGKKAPNIIIGESSLYKIKAKQTIVIFWSTTCSHCLKEIPKVYEMLKDRTDLKVVLVGLEESYSDWEQVIPKFPNWQHLRANGKWDNEYAKAYNIKSTPVYFVLDENKIISNKPNKLKDLELLFNIEEK